LSAGIFCGCFYTFCYFSSNEELLLQVFTHRIASTAHNIAVARCSDASEGSATLQTEVFTSAALPPSNFSLYCSCSLPPPGQVPTPLLLASSSQPPRLHHQAALLTLAEILEDDSVAQFLAFHHHCDPAVQEDHRRAVLVSVGRD
jgi:hypothetical protein